MIEVTIKANTGGAYAEVKSVNTLVLKVVGGTTEDAARIIAGWLQGRR